MGYTAELPGMPAEALAAAAEALAGPKRWRRGCGDADAREAFLAALSGAWRIAYRPAEAIDRDLTVSRLKAAKAAAEALAEAMARLGEGEAEALAYVVPGMRRDVAKYARALDLLLTDFRRGAGGYDRIAGADELFVSQAAMSWLFHFGRTPSARDGSPFSDVMRAAMLAGGRTELGEAARQRIVAEALPQG